ncbi:MAG: hypothetical protein GXY83_21195 [Rhodopirellula sp.]|nr:hypothetical protein [Rhodopirellula sp.]
MDDAYRQFQTLLELDARHDELLDQLDELDKQVGCVLAEWTANRGVSEATLPAAPSGPPSTF